MRPGSVLMLRGSMRELTKLDRVGPDGGPAAGVVGPAGAMLGRVRGEGVLLGSDVGVGEGDDDEGADGLDEGLGADVVVTRASGLPLGLGVLPWGGWGVALVAVVDDAVVDCVVVEEVAGVAVGVGVEAGVGVGVGHATATLCGGLAVVGESRMTPTTELVPQELAGGGMESGAVQSLSIVDVAHAALFQVKSTG